MWSPVHAQRSPNQARPAAHDHQEGAHLADRGWKIKPNNYVRSTQKHCAPARHAGLHVYASVRGTEQKSNSTFLPFKHQRLDTQDTPFLLLVDFYLIKSPLQFSIEVYSLSMWCKFLWIFVTSLLHRKINPTIVAISMLCICVWFRADHNLVKNFRQVFLFLGSVWFAI